MSVGLLLSSSTHRIECPGLHAPNFILWLLLSPPGFRFNVFITLLQAQLQHMFVEQFWLINSWPRRIPSPKLEYSWIFPPKIPWHLWFTKILFFEKLSILPNWASPYPRNENFIQFLIKKFLILFSFLSVIFLVLQNIWNIYMCVYSTYFFIIIFFEKHIFTNIQVVTWSIEPRVEKALINVEQCPIGDYCFLMASVFYFVGFFFFFFWWNKHVSFTVKCASSSKKIPNSSNQKFGKRKKREKKAQSVGFFCLFCKFSSLSRFIQSFFVTKII